MQVHAVFETVMIPLGSKMVVPTHLGDNSAWIMRRVVSVASAVIQRWKDEDFSARSLRREECARDWQPLRGKILGTQSSTPHRRRTAIRQDGGRERRSDIPTAYDRRCAGYRE